jgi:hypothetical protein
MVLLAEQLRVLEKEASLVDDATGYTRSTSGWGTIKDYGNITLSEPALIVFSFQVSASYGGIRLKIGSYYVFCRYYGSSISGTYTGIAYAAAGTHNVLAEAYYSGSVVTISNFKLGKTNFVDEAGSALSTYSSTRNVTVTERTTPLGALANAVFMVRCYGYTSGQTNFENVGDALTNGVSLFVDGVQVDWIERWQDTTGSRGASAFWYGALSVGVSHSFQIVKDNGGNNYSH